VKKTIFLSFFLTLGSFFLLQAQAIPNWVWANDGGGATNSTTIGSAIATDALGNNYAAGYFLSATLNFGTTDLNVMGSADNASDLFLAKIGKGATGMNSLESSDNISIYPNPSNGIFIIERDGGRGTGDEVEIYNALGEIVFKTKIANEKTEIDLTANANGIYFVRVVSRDKMYSAKITKQ